MTNTIEGQIREILSYFAYDHLPPHLREVSKPLAILAKKFAAELSASEELLAGLRKLLEAKDCLVRSAFYSAPAPSSPYQPHNAAWRMPSE